MSEDKFDAIVVGAGVVGSVAALVMARARLITGDQRGDSADRSVTGGICPRLKQSFQALQSARKRKVTREKISF